MKLIRLNRAAFAVAALLGAACGGTGSDGQAGPPGAPGEPGAAGEPGKAADPGSSIGASINQINPRVGLVDRKIQVLVTFDGKVDLSKATVDFGANGVKVDKATPAGNGLLVDLEVDIAAKLGKRDVTVKIGDKSATAKEGFAVAVPLDAKIVAGKAEQGGMARLALTNRDRIWFDKTNFRLFAVAGEKDPTILSFTNESLTETNASVILLGDPLAKTGPLAFLGVNDPRYADSPTYLTDSSAVSVTSRSPVALAEGTAVDKTFAADLETGLYSIELAPQNGEGLIVETTAAIAPDSPIIPMILAYPASGAIVDLLEQAYDPGFPPFGIPPGDAHSIYPVAAATRGFLTVIDANLGHGANIKTSVSYKTTRAALKTEGAAAHATVETAQALGAFPAIDAPAAACVVSGELKTAGEVDIYTVTGFSADEIEDLLATVNSDAHISVRVDSDPEFGSGWDAAEVIPSSGSAGNGRSYDLSGETRYIEVKAAANATKPTGKYTLGLKRLPPF